jgi:hypothetical protein
MTNNDPRAENIRRLCPERGIRIEQVGISYRLTGRGVSVLTTSVANLTEADLRPCLIHQSPHRPSHVSAIVVGNNEKYDPQ